jgi:hypothetical protein
MSTNNCRNKLPFPRLQMESRLGQPVPQAKAALLAALTWTQQLSAPCPIAPQASHGVSLTQPVPPVQAALPHNTTTQHRQVPRAVFRDQPLLLLLLLLAQLTLVTVSPRQGR